MMFISSHSNIQHTHTIQTEKEPVLMDFNFRILKGHRFLSFV